MKVSYKAARINAGITQKDAADSLGITQGTLLSYEKGYREPKADMLRRMSELYACEVGDFRPNQGVTDIESDDER